MKPAQETYPPPRPSYLGVSITYPERDEPQPIDDLRTNLAEKFLSLGGSVSETNPNQKNSLGSQEHMQVYLRVRPFTAVEIEQNEAQDCISIPDSSSVLVKPPHNSQSCRLSDKGNGSMAQKFTFTHVFGPDTTQAQFFDGTIKQHVIDFMKGQNRLIFTYGVTNAGKTFTFQDLQWIEVSDATEACKILALGKKFQSIAYTKLNSSSSRSHSIFTVRLLKIEDSDIPRVLKVSELALCDLAGSERCTKTQNEGERLKESGNINTSLLILGKCINALKTSQHSKAHQHVPFRESKLTHYLQSFFSGKGKVCMIVNICQSASSYDETLNVLKFSAVAQKVLILESSQNSEAYGQRKSAREVSFIINNADSKVWNSRKRATVQWDSRLEDVPEDGNSEEDSEEEECLDCTYQDEEEDDGVQEDELVIKKDAYQKLLDLVEDLKTKLVNEKKDKLLMELKIREEVAKEFTEHFMQREKDFSEHLEKEKELMEERCDERIEIFQDLVRKCSKSEDEGEEDENRDNTADQVEQTDTPIDGLFISMQNDLAVIKKQAMDAQVQIISIPDVPGIISKMEQKLKQISCDLSKTQEELKKKSSQLEIQIAKCSRATIQLEETEKKLSSNKQQIDQLVSMIEQKESAIDRLKDLVSHWEAKCEDYEKTVNGIKGEMIKVNTSAAGRKRPPEDHQCPEEQPPSKKEFAEVIDTHRPAALKQTHVNNNSKEPAIQQEVEGLRVETENYKTQIHNLNCSVSLLEEKLARSEEQVTEMKSKNQTLISELQACNDRTFSLEGTVKMLMQELDQNKLNSANKVAQIRTIQNKLDEIGKRVDIQGKADEDFSNIHDLVEECNQKNCQLDNLKESNSAKVSSNRESTFYSAIDGLWKKCQEVLQESSKKKHLIQELEQKLETLDKDINTMKNEREDLQTKLNAQISTLNEKDDLIVHLRNLLSERTDILENQRNEEAESEKAIQELKNQANANVQQIKELQCLLDSYKEKCESLKCLEEQNKASASDTLQLEQNLKEAQTKYEAYEKDITTLNEENRKLGKNITELQEKLNAAEKTSKDKEEQVGQSAKEIELLKKDLSQRASELKVLQLDLQRKEEDCTELKDKLMDSKKQIQQVEKEVSGMREEKRLLTNKVNEYEKLKNQMSRELEMKQRTIQQLKKESADNEKNGDVMQLYQKACQEAQEKEKIIEDMKETLIEQEQTQVEQDQVLEAKEVEAEKLSQELEEWKQKYKELENNLYKGQVKPDCETNNAERNEGELSKLKDQLKEREEKNNTERKKWLEEKMNLLAQAKESETHRNKEMRKFAEERERYNKHQAEMEHLTLQLTEKDNTLQKWREERDQLLSALEIQLKSLLSSNMEKDKEIENLKKSSTSRTQEEASDVAELKRLLSVREDAIKELQQNLANSQDSKTNKTVANQEGTEEKTETVKPEQVNRELNNTKISVDSSSSADDCQSQGGSDTVLDSSAISTEFGKVSRFPRPEMEIHFSPMRPNKMEVKHHGESSPRTVKITRTTRKRKSDEMEQEAVKSENKKNTISRAGVKTPSSQSTVATNKSETKRVQRSTLKKQPSVSSTVSTTSARKKDGTLQKLGDFLQSSPSIFQTKAKKLLETIAAPKALDVGICKAENDNKPKKNRRKLYTTDISVPLDIPANSIVMDTNEKESDHLIMKRRLRTRTAK
uniref:Kinesin family member 20B n=1 Tax=Xenopus tropicalis TaxID=8364 RepID=F6ZUG9_XENTR